MLICAFFEIRLQILFVMTLKMVIGFIEFDIGIITGKGIKGKCCGALKCFDDV